MFHFSKCHQTWLPWPDLVLRWASWVLGWSPSKNMSGVPELRTKWPPGLKIEKRGGWWIFKVLLLRIYYKADFNQTLLLLSLDGALPKICLITLTSNQYGRHAKNRKKGGWITKIFSWNHGSNFNQILLKWCFGGLLSKLCLTVPTPDQESCHSGI